MHLLTRLFSKRNSLVALLVLSLATLLTTTQTWVVVQLDDSASIVDEIALAGNTLTPLAAALSLAGIAGVAALSIANRTLRFVILAVEVIASIGIVWSVLIVAANPLAAAVPHLAEATGLTGIATFEQHLDALQLRVWVMNTALLGILMLLVTFFALLTCAGWGNTKSRYQRKNTALNEQSPHSMEAESSSKVGSLDRIDDWDAISEGKDPSDR